MDEINEQMFIAIDDIEVIRRLIEQGADVNASHDDYISPVFTTVALEEHKILELLLESGAEPSLERQDQDGWRPLHLACTNRTHSCVPVLLAAGVDVNAKTNDGTSALFLASSCSDLKSAASAANDLLKCGAHPDEPTNLGHTPLLAAIFRNNRDLVKLLLRAGAETVHRTFPLDHSAAAFRHLLDGVRAAGDWKQWCSKHRRVLSGLVAKLAPRPGKPQRAGRARRAVARPFPLDAASHVVSFLCPEGGY